MENDRLNQKELAELVGLSPSRINKMRHEAFPPPLDADGLISVADAFRWMIERETRKVENRGPRDDATAALTRKNNALAHKTELEIAQRESELIPADDAAAAWQDIQRRVTDRLLRIAPEIAPTVAAMDNETEIQAALDSAIRHALTELSVGVPLAEVPRSLSELIRDR